jgi:hypothetical protein
MTDRRKGRKVIDQDIVTAVPLSYQPPEPAFAITVGIPVEIVPTHLVDHDAHDQLWLVNGRTMNGLTGNQ